MNAELRARYHGGLRAADPVRRAVARHQLDRLGRPLPTSGPAAPRPSCRPHVPRGARWRVLHAPRRGGATVVRAELPLGYAQEVAEDFARRAGAGPLLNPRARWRHDPPSEQPLAVLAKFNRPASLARGEAQTASSAMAARRWR